jgi:hypothetical protein
MCAIKNVFIRNNVNKSVLMSKSHVSNFTALCLRVLSRNILLKLISFGYYVGNFNIDERLDGIPPMDNNALINEKDLQTFLKTKISIKFERKYLSLGQ